MKIIFMGSPKFAVSALKSLVDSGHDIVLVVSQQDKPRGRKKIMTPTEVKSYSMELGLPVITPEKINVSEVIDELKSYNADLMVVAAYGKILSEAVLNLCPYGSINVHASLLPKFRGASPIQSAIMAGEAETGITIMYMAKQLDAGDMIASASINIGSDETYGQVHDRLAVLGGKLLSNTIAQLEVGKCNRVEQDHSKASFTKLLKRDDELIDWNNDVTVIHNQVRGLSPSPMSYTLLNGDPIKITDTKVVLSDSIDDLGCIVDVNKNLGIKVACRGGYLWIGKLQPAGKKLVSGADYYRGIKNKESFRLF